MFLVLRKSHPAYKDKPINCKISKPNYSTNFGFKNQKKKKNEK